MTDIRCLGRIALLALVYYVTAQAGLLFSVVGNTVTLVWPPSGIALVAVLAFGPHLAVGVALGAFLANASTDISIAVALAIAIGNTLEALVGAFLLRRVASFRIEMDRRQDVFALILVALLVTNISAVIGSAALTVGGSLAPTVFASTWLKWWLGDMMGVLVVAPPLLAWLSWERSAVRPVTSLAQAAEAAVLFAALFAAGYAIFLAPELSGRGHYSGALAVFPFVVWGALRFDTWGASLATLLIAALAISGTTQGIGPFAVASSVEALVRWCTFANVIAVTGMLLSAASKESRIIHEQLKKSHHRLEQEVSHRTAELANSNDGLRQEIAERKALEAELLLSGESLRRAMGRDLHDGLGQQLTSIAFFGATLHQQLAGQSRPEAATSQRIVDMINQSIDTVRAVSRGLYPVALESSGLSAALNELAESTAMIHQITCRFREISPLSSSDPLVTINLYRIAQEAINNAIKHGKAKSLNIELGEANGHVRLVIMDDGVGFQADDIPEGSAFVPGREGMGLRNMQYRAELLGGVFSLNRNPHGGATAVVIFPLV